MFARDVMHVAVRWTSRVLLLSLAALFGCGRPVTSVTGTVLFQGKPVPSGTVLFHGSGGRVEHTLIGEGGRYSVADAPPGLVHITVRSHAETPIGLPSRRGKAPAVPPELVPATQPRHAGNFVRLPPRYEDPQKSGLTYTVHVGPQTHDIELQP